VEPSVARSEAAAPAESGPPAPVPVRLLRKAPEPNQRPALRRVERPAPEPELVEEPQAEPDDDAVDDALAAEFGDAEPSVARAPRSFLGRMVDAVRGRPSEPVAPAAHDDGPAASAEPVSGAASPAAPTVQPRAAAGVQRSPAAAQPAAEAAPRATPAPGTGLARSARPAASGTGATPRSAALPVPAAAPAAAAAPALARTAAPARPALSLVPAPPVPEPTAGPAAIARSGADELAAATGGQLDYGDDGMATIDFTGPGSPTIPAFSTTPVTVTREVAPAPTGDVLARAVTDVAADTPQSSASTSHSGIPDSAAPAKPQDPEELYEEVMTRLRRDLIAELEQNGHLLRDTL